MKADNITGAHHDNHSYRNPRTHSDRRIAIVAAQQKLGIWSKRFVRPCGNRLDRAAFDRPTVIVKAVVKAVLPKKSHVRIQRCNVVFYCAFCSLDDEFKFDHLIASLHARIK